MLDANGADISDASHIGNLNPFRYRGYYYDTETGLYYLKSRYYDPEVGRFITIDDIQILSISKEVINGLNLYSYCNNNPVNDKDETGYIFGFLLGLLVGAIVGTIVSVAGTFIGDIANNIWNNGFNFAAWEFSNWQTYAGAAIGGFIGGALGVAFPGSYVLVAGVTGAISAFATDVLEYATTVSAVNAVRNGGGFSDGLGAFVGGFITGGVIGATAILGGGLAVGAFTVTVGSIIGTATFLTAGTFVGGVFANWAESKITGESFSWNDALNQGILTMFAGITNFAVGYAMGTAGLWNSLKSGNGFMDTIKLSRTAFITEVGRAGVKSIFVGALSYLQTNIVSMIVRSIIKFIFTKPWKDGISTL